MARTATTGNRRNASRDLAQPAERSWLAASRLWLLGTCVALSIARLLSPSESVAWRGDGLPLDLIWLVALLGWATAAWHDRRVTVRAGWIDAGVALLVAWSAVAAIHSAQVDAPRPAMNMLFNWLALGAALWLWRQLIADEREVRTLIAVFVAIAVGISGYGLHQYFVSLPADRARYLADPDAALAAEGLNFPAGSIERELFEQRLMSTEPPATFALANSLAGWLVPWLLVAVAVGWFAWRDRRGNNVAGTSRVLVGVLLMLTVAGLVLLLTKSRSAVVALAAGVPLLVWALRRGRELHLRRAALVGSAIAAAVVLLIAIGVFAGGLDREVLSEAPKSLGFRWQYWQATATMVRDLPWLGCGPGNFGDHYTRYKLPTASEEITDPHNLFLEIAATAGLPAALALAAVLAGVLWLWFRGCVREDQEMVGAVTSNARQSSRLSTGQRAILVGALAGLALAWIAPYATGGLIDIAPGLVLTIACGAIGAGIVWLLWPWVEHGTLAAPMLAAAALALAVNLLAAGGIAFPAVAGAMWLLIALTLDVTEMSVEQSAIRTSGRMVRRINVGRIPLSIAGLASLTAVVGCYWFGYRPVVLSLLESSAARAASGTEIEQLLESAADNDPYAAQPQLDLAQWNFERWNHDQQPQSFAQFEATVNKAIELRPSQSAVWLRVGLWYRQVAARTHQAEHFDRAVDACRRAVELYPNHAREHAMLALACHAAGHGEDAQREAAEAWRFDALTPHADQRLHDDLRRELVSAGLGPAEPVEPSAR
jgi:hypothetical protein